MEKNTESFRALFDANYGHIRSYMLRRAPFQDVDGLVSEVFTTAFRRLESIPQGEQESLWWLYATSRKVLSNYRRSNKRFSSLKVKLLSEQSPAPSDNQGESFYVETALKMLKEQDKEILILHFWEDLSVVEISKVLSTSPSTAQKRLQRAKSRFSSQYRKLTAESSLSSLSEKEPHLDIKDTNAGSKSTKEPDSYKEDQI